MTPSDTAVFLGEKESCAGHRDGSGPSAKKPLLNFGGGAKETPLSTEEHHIQDAAAKFSERDKLMAGEVLDFTETTRIEIKNLSTESILEYIRKTLPKYVSAFANTQVGFFFFFGVDDESREVIGSHSEAERKALVKTVADTVGSMPVHHFCGSKAGAQFQTYILSIYEEAGGLQGYVYAARVEPFCCTLFHDNPHSRVATDATAERLSVRKWTEFMTQADPELGHLVSSKDRVTEKAEEVVLGSQQSHPVAGLDLAFKLYSHPCSGSKEIKWKPETICADLFSEYPGLEDLMKKWIHPLNKGVPIFSRSWAVDIGLLKKQDVVCDALLVAENAYPVLYTVVEGASSAESENSRETAHTLKQKLVNVGGYDSKACVTPQMLHLNGAKKQQENRCGYPSLYPENYILTSRDIPAFLPALVIAVLSFRSFLSGLLGSEIFNLLTLKQYELLSKNLHKVKKQFVLGLPGTGKTIMALKIERIRNIFHCSAAEILYNCENQPLKKFVG
ncbi:schlafen family member 5-like [Larus michahellis]|uniref:schlafen family member 5-like n=1 Tax=Larus michahellis TaxID=119627 RepID=UPI003D9B5B75